MKELVVHVVNPARSQLFITYAAYIAKDLDLTVRYVHVHSASGSGPSQDEREQIQKKAGHHFQLQIQNLYAADADLPLLEYAVEFGSPPDIMQGYCKSGKVDTIMLSGSKEYSFFSDDTGNIDIIKKVRCPVWIVPEGITYRPFSEIIYATDYHEEDLPNLKILARFASKFPAKITAVHITDDTGFGEQIKGEGFENMIKKETGYELLSVKVLAEEKGESLVTGLHNFALMVDADLIVLLREKRSLSERLIHGSRSEKIARDTKLPVLIFNEERRKVPAPG
jgi:nucleotide-binding universal stress UspA family protein